jgi:hypothetical protein
VSDAGVATHTASPMRKVPIDIMRAVSMLYIVGFWHSLDYTKVVTWHYNPVTYRLTVGALSLFVLISGFLTGRQDGGLARGEIWRFYKTRFWRIYLPFVIASGLFLAAGVSDAFALFKGVTLVAMLLAPPPFTLWFVNMILLFYLIAPLLIGLRGNAVAYIALCTVIVGAMVLYQAGTGRMDMRLILYFPCFAAGIFLAARSLPSSTLSLIGLSLLAALSLVPTLARASWTLEGDPCAASLGAFRLYRSVCCRHAGWSESETARDTHAVQRGELLHVPSASSPLSLDAERLVSDYRESASSLSVVRLSADHRDRGMALPESLHRIFATA